MLNKFDDNPTFAKRGLQIWLVLIGKAANRQTVTYGELAGELGFEGAGTLAGMLNHVLLFCEQNRLPPLTSIVVNQETGLPGDGFGDGDAVHLAKAQAGVFRYRWYHLVPPTSEELAEAVRVAHKS